MGYTFKEVSSAPLSHFVRCIHIGHELGEGAGDGAGPDPCHQVNLPPPENPRGQFKRNQDQGSISELELGLKCTASHTLQR